ncbi:hypothetical protein CANARDRAFT_193121 [[Candida] arabinofermentans NRRL YB-2248]|uniref:RWD domain-containing protein n=1 Tax=[Candida] arabinofermentans NRRL YB-2248 TaxID=983967 RepID=A0A1E4T8F5_9ASCO|nr:hypothetical protein CANARDRAFT_193121 [[Candida] arabinofermentans NRRL YB-2248]
MESQELQDETGAIEAIYPDCIQRLAPLIYKFKVPQHEHITIQMSFPEEYPQELPHILDVLSEKEGYDEGYLTNLFQEVLESIFNEGDVCIFDFFTELDAVLYTGEEEQEEEAQESHWNAEDNNSSVVAKQVDYLKGWSISDPIVDRKSTFVAFAKRVTSIDDAYDFLETLKMDKKVSRAQHCMTAWRIKSEESSAQYQDCDDDGETAAGGRLLHLLTIMDAWNVMVVVCRWFGGIHIGPDRFKHINASARDAVVKGGFVTLDGSGAVKKGKKKK